MNPVQVETVPAAFWIGASACWATRYVAVSTWTDEEEARAAMKRQWAEDGGAPPVYAPSSGTWAERTGLWSVFVPQDDPAT